jgi:hypothetical protein
MIDNRSVSVAMPSQNKLAIGMPLRSGAGMTNSVSTPMPALGCASWKGGTFQWVQVPPGDRSSRKQPEQLWR